MRLYFSKFELRGIREQRHHTRQSVRSNEPNGSASYFHIGIYIAIRALRQLRHECQENLCH